jgi:hypothetical protein
MVLHRDAASLVGREAVVLGVNTLLGVNTQGDKGLSWRISNR